MPGRHAGTTPAVTTAAATAATAITIAIAVTIVATISIVAIIVIVMAIITAIYLSRATKDPSSWVPCCGNQVDDLPTALHVYLGCGQRELDLSPDTCTKMHKTFQHIRAGNSAATGGDFGFSNAKNTRSPETGGASSTGDLQTGGESPGSVCWI